MKWSQDGSAVEMTAAEYGELVGRSQEAEKQAKGAVAQAVRERDSARELLIKALDQNNNRYTDDLVNAIRQRENAQREVVSDAEHFLQELYFKFGQFDRHQVSELQARMKAIREGRWPRNSDDTGGEQKR